MSSATSRPKRRIKFQTIGNNSNKKKRTATRPYSAVYQHRSLPRHVGFDWEERSQVWDKVKEEISEFEREVAHADADKAEAEFGDVLFSLVNAARLYGINPDTALERTNQKFTRRFNYLEAHTIKQGRKLTDMTLAEMDEIWDEAKRQEIQGGNAEK